MILYFYVSFMKSIAEWWPSIVRFQIFNPTLTRYYHYSNIIRSRRKKNKDYSWKKLTLKELWGQSDYFRQDLVLCKKRLILIIRWMFYIFYCLFNWYKKTPKNTHFYVHPGFFFWSIKEFIVQNVGLLASVVNGNGWYLVCHVESGS